MNFKRYFNADATETPAGGSAKEEVVIGRTFSFGDFAGQEDDTSDDPEDDTQIQTDNTSSDTVDTVSDNADVSTDTADNKNTDTVQTDASEPVKEPEAKPALAELSLEEVLKDRDRSEVLRALGVNEEILSILESAQSIEQLKSVIDARTMNWDAVPHEEVLRQNLREEYSDLDDAKFEKIFKAEMKKYNLDSFDDEEKELGQIRLERDANRVRKVKKEAQASFKLPEPKPSTEAQQYKEAREKAEREYQTFVQEVNNNPVTKKLTAEKKIVIGSGDKAYNFEVEPTRLHEAIVDTNKLFASCINADGTYNLERAYKIANYALNMDQVEKAYYDFAISQANKEFVDTVVNPSSKEQRPVSKKEETLQEAFVNRGVHTSLGAILGR